MNEKDRITRKNESGQSESGGWITKKQKTKLPGKKPWLERNPTFTVPSQEVNNFQLLLVSGRLHIFNGVRTKNSRRKTHFVP